MQRQKYQYKSDNKGLDKEKEHQKFTLKKREPFLAKDSISGLQLGQLKKIREKGTVIGCRLYLKEITSVKLLSIWRREKLKREVVVDGIVQDVVDVDFFCFYARVVDKVKKTFG